MPLTDRLQSLSVSKLRKSPERKLEPALLPTHDPNCVHSVVSPYTIPYEPDRVLGRCFMISPSLFLHL